MGRLLLFVRSVRSAHGGCHVSLHPCNAVWSWTKMSATRSKMTGFGAGFSYVPDSICLAISRTSSAGLLRISRTSVFVIPDSPERIFCLAAGDASAIASTPFAKCSLLITVFRPIPCCSERISTVFPLGFFEIKLPLWKLDFLSARPSPPHFFFVASYSLPNKYCFCSSVECLRPRWFWHIQIMASSRQPMSRVHHLVRGRQRSQKRAGRFLRHKCRKGFAVFRRMLRMALQSRFSKVSSGVIKCQVCSRCSQLKSGAEFWRRN